MYPAGKKPKVFIKVKSELDSKSSARFTTLGHALCATSVSTVNRGRSDYIQRPELVEKSYVGNTSRYGSSFANSENERFFYVG